MFQDRGGEVGSAVMRAPARRNGDQTRQQRDWTFIQRRLFGQRDLSSSHMTLRPLIALFLIPLVAITLLLANFLQLLSLLLLPISNPLFREANRRISQAWFMILLASLRGLGVRFVLTGETLPWKENAFVVANHQAMADIPAVLWLAQQSGRLADTKWFVKHSLKWVPGIGWGLQFLDCLFLKRNWTEDKQKVEETFSRIQRNQSPFWVISFLEGTRSTPEKITKSQEYARQQNLPQLKYVMQPRTRGFEATLQGLSPRTEAVYDLTIGYPGKRPNLMHLFFGPLEEIHLHTKRFFRWPEKPEDQSQWVRELFREKDNLLEKFFKDGKFPSH